MIVDALLREGVSERVVDLRALGDADEVIRVPVVDRIDAALLNTQIQELISKLSPGAVELTSPGGVYSKVTFGASGNAPSGSGIRIGVV